ncbi:FkbM family methyltransferase [Calothrix sp. NIES-3974]|uniref:FkbM family methyltransferase n=1 Tax=Calothrix sp. NIES-3974 TaxID=2005462 RepID=UPI000B5F80A2|nr:FkbM family methyltransferase [Calothrix sp. NIES-3974]BAZ04399.1 methyltransferase FkbM family protein [Calothrix sp. NIES-3974]
MKLFEFFKNLVYQKFPGFIFRFLAHSNDAIADLKKYNFSMVLNLDDNAISRPILVKGEYEQHVTQVLLKYLQHCKPELYFFDIGANLGYYSLLVASQCPQAKIYSFEPDKNNFRLFTTSINYNQFQTAIAPYRLAVSDENKTIVISNLGNQANYGARFTGNTVHELRNYVHGENPYYEEIPAVRLDDFLADIPVDIVKIDIEGYEPSALKGMVNLLKKNHPIIFAEFAPSNLKVFGKIEPQEFLYFFTNLNYTINLIDKKGQVIAYEQNINQLIQDFATYQTHHVDLIFTPGRKSESNPV